MKIKAKVEYFKEIKKKIKTVGAHWFHAAVDQSLGYAFEVKLLLSPIQQIH